MISSISSLHIGMVLKLYVFFHQKREKANICVIKFLLQMMDFSSVSTSEVSAFVRINTDIASWKLACSDKRFQLCWTNISWF